MAEHKQQISDDVYAQAKKQEKSLGWHLKHVDQGVTLYLHNSAKNWVWILTCFAFLWTFVGLFFFTLLAVEIEYGISFMYFALAVFSLFVTAVAAAVTVGQVERLQNVEENLIEDGAAIDVEESKKTCGCF